MPALRLRLEKGSLAIFQGASVKILTVFDPGQILVEIVGTRRTAWVSAGDLTGHSNELFAGRRDPATKVVREHLDPVINRAEEWVKEFDTHLTQSGFDASAVSSIALAMKSSEKTVLRHLDAYLADRSPSAQLPAKPGPESGSSPLPPAVIAVINKQIDTYYESEQRPTIAATKLQIDTMCKLAGLDAPSYGAVRNQIKLRERSKTETKRHGRVRGKALAGPAGPPVNEAGVLGFVQMDHAICDVILVDPATREEIGRPWITLAIDIETRCIPGFYLTYDDPSQTSVALALEHCCCPKDDWLREIGFDGEWLPFGLPKVIGWDNGKCFKPTPLADGCRKFGIEPCFREVKTPTHGAHIERYIGNYMGKVHLLKGTTFSNTKQREDYNSQKKSVMTLDEFTLWTVHQINGIYHNTKHRELGMTPRQAWKLAMEKSGKRIPEFPADRRLFLLSLLPQVLRPITREGIARFGTHYWDDSLAPFVGKDKKYPVAHNPHDISVVYPLINGSFLDVPMSCRKWISVSLWEWYRSKKALKEQFPSGSSDEAVLEHVCRTREIEDNAERQTRQQRKNIARRPPKKSTEAEKRALVDYSYTSRAKLDPREAFK